MKLGRRITYASLSLVAAAGVWWALRPAPRPLDVAQIRRGELVQSFEEEGRTELARRWVVAAPVTGTLHRIDLLQGDTVKVGQLLARIEPARAQLLDPANRMRLLAEEQAAQASMQAARQRQRGAGADAELATREVTRMRKLGATGAVSVQALDNAEAQVSRAQAAAAAAAADYRAADQQRAALLALLSAQGSAGGRMLPLLAPIDGVVLRRYRQSSTPVQAGEPLLELGDLGQLQVMVEALSQQASQLHPGTPAHLLRWGGDGALPARVVRVEPGGYTKISALGVEEQRTQVWLDIVAPRAQWARLGDGYRVEVTFDVARKKDVLKAPASALFREGTRWAAYRVDGDRLRLVYVVPTMSGGTEVEIIRGLAEGDRVVAFPDDRLREGQRIRTLEPQDRSADQ